MIRKTDRRKGRLWKVGLLLLCFLLLGGCQAQEEAQQLMEEAVVLFGGEPSEVRKLREEAVKETDGIHQEYYFKQLTDEEKQVYRQLQQGVEEFQEEIFITSAEDAVLERAYDALLRDHSELFWIHGKGVVYKTLYNTYGKFQPSYVYTREEAEKISAALEEKAMQIVSGISADASDYEKARYIYGTVIQNTTYQIGDQDQNIAGALYEDQAVCAGYARAVQYLLEQLGVECIYVSGDMQGSDQGHAWNVVSLDGNYYYLDATNGDQQDFLPVTEGEPQSVLYDYLCPFPEEYAAICQDDGEFQIPVCTAVDYNSYVQNGNCFSTWDQEALRQYFMEQIEMGSPVFSVKFIQRQDYETAKTVWIDEEEIRSIATYYMEWNGIHQVQYSYGLLDDLNTMYFMF